MLFNMLMILSVKSHKIGVNILNHKVLKVKCIIAALFEFILPFMTAIKAATQVPTFAPKVINKAL
mgnify:CR=1 FL=1